MKKILLYAHFLKSENDIALQSMLNFLSFHTKLLKDQLVFLEVERVHNFHCRSILINSWRAFLGSPVVKTLPSNAGGLQVQSLVRELSSHMPHD